MKKAHRLTPHPILRKVALFAAAFLLLPAAPAAAQLPREAMAQGDSAAAALNPELAIQHYERVLAADSMNFEALWKLSMNAVDLGEFESNRAKREALYAKAERTARRAVAVNGSDAEARFHLARALGMAALAVGVRERIQYAREVREEALASLALDPRHPGALHVMGVWHAEVMRLSGLERTLARAFLGAGFFSEASWDEAIRYMEESARVDPERLTHHLDLARIYRDRRMNAQARASYQRVLDGRSVHYNDDRYKEQARAEMARIR